MVVESWYDQILDSVKVGRLDRFSLLVEQPPRTEGSGLLTASARLRCMEEEHVFQDQGGDDFITSHPGSDRDYVAPPDPASG